MFRVSHVNLQAVERFMEEKINTDKKTPWSFENAPCVGAIDTGRPGRSSRNMHRSFRDNSGSTTMVGPVRSL